MQQATAPDNVQQFSQLPLEVQNKVQAITFDLPPNLTTDESQLWIDTAKLQYGIALQRLELGRARMSSLRQHHASLVRRGDVTKAELDDLKNQPIGEEKSYKESLGFLQNFKEQQENFKAYWREKRESGEVAFTSPWPLTLFDPNVRTIVKGEGRDPNRKLLERYGQRDLTVR